MRPTDFTDLGSLIGYVIAAVGFLYLVIHHHKE